MFSRLTLFALFVFGVLSWNEEDFLRSGALVEEIGPVQFTKGIFAAEISLSTDEYIRHNFELGYYHLKKLTRQTFKFDIQDATERIVLHNSVQEINHFLETLLTSVSDIRFEDGNLTDSYEIKQDWSLEMMTINKFFENSASNSDEQEQQEKEERVKRGLFNAVGYAMNYLFGVGLDSDAQELKAQVGELGKQVEVFGNNLNLTISRMHDVLNVTMKNIQNMETEMENLSGQGEIFHNFLFLLHSWEKMAEFFKYISHLSYEVKNNKMLLSSGILPSVITLEQLKTIVKEGEQKLKMKFPVENLTADNMFNALKITRVKSTSSSDKWILLLPYVAEEKTTLYGLKPYPVLIEDKLAVPVLDKYVAVKYGHSGATSYTILDDLESCSQYGVPTKTVCDVTDPSYSISVPNCATNLVVYRSGRKVCSYQEIELEHGAYTVYSNNKWYIYLHNSTKATLSCAGKKGTKLETFKGSLKVGSHCTFKTGKFSVATTEIAHVKFFNTIEQFPFSNITEETVSFVKDNIYVMKKLDSGIKQLNDLKNIHVPEIIREHKSEYMKYFTSSWTIFVIVSVCCVVGYVVYRCRSKRAGRRMSSEQVDAMESNARATRQLVKVLKNNTVINMENPTSAPPKNNLYPNLPSEPKNKLYPTLD